ncbi:hypothetical protein ACVWY2_004788 [Bradyrhizobium sp. JR6.1]
MSRALKCLLMMSVLFGGAVPARAAEDRALERGTAVIDPAILREFDHGRLSLGRMLAPERSADTPLSNRDLFGLPAMVPVREALDREFNGYVAKHRVSLPNESIGVGDSFAFQLFDRALFESADVRFVLAGIVNRMDRAYVAPKDCGEIRLIYRLTRTDVPLIGENAVSQRLPMTLNLVLKAKGNGNDALLTCREIARRWLATGSAPPAIDKLFGKDGPLDLIDARNIDRIETNLQIAHAPKSAVRDFRTDYLLKVFDYDDGAKRFVEAPLENQIDRDRVIADEALKRDFKTWLLDPKHFAELDRGTLLIPDKFLASGAVAPTPTGFDVSDLEPEYGLVQGEGAAGNAVFSEGDVVGALQKAAADGTKLQNIQSLAGFERRLNDVTCAGCHQTPRHWRLPFPRRRLDGGKTVELHRGAGLAAFLRRPTSAPRYSRKLPRRQGAGLLARLLQPAATTRRRRACRHRIQRRLGRALLSAGRQAGRDRPQLSRLDLRRRPRLPGRGEDLTDGHVLREGPVIPVGTEAAARHCLMLHCGSRPRPEQPSP